jgi:hypothetical protein
MVRALFDLDQLTCSPLQKNSRSEGTSGPLMDIGCAKIRLEEEGEIGRAIHKTSTLKH